MSGPGGDGSAPRGLVCSWGVLPGGVSAPRGVFWPGGWVSASGGGLLPGGMAPGGCLLPGGLVWPRGEGGCLLRGVCSWGVCLRHDPPVNRMTNRCKNITLATTSLRPVKMVRIPRAFLEMSLKLTRSLRVVCERSFRASNGSIF